MMLSRGVSGIAGDARTKVLVGSICALLLLIAGQGRAAAAETHVFDAALSLTGNCKTGPTDEIPDPGCPEGEHPPAGPFSDPRGVAIDAYGNIYVSSYGPLGGASGRIDVFDPTGVFITEVSDPYGPKDIAVDSEGNLYVYNNGGTPPHVEVVRFTPVTYNGATGEIAYGSAESPIINPPQAEAIAVAINPENDRLFVNLGTHINEYGSAASGEENKLLDDEIGKGQLQNVHGGGLAIDAAHQRIYASDAYELDRRYGRIKVFDLESPHSLLLTIEGSDVPGGKDFENNLTVTADEGTGHFFIYDGKKVYEFAEDGTFLSVIEHEFRAELAALEVDNGANSPNGADNPDGRYLFVPSRDPKATGPGHSYAFGSAPPTCPPDVESATFEEATETDVELHGRVNPCNLPTSYRFEYTTASRFETEGFAGAAVVGAGNLPAGAAGAAVSTAITGLAPGTAYRFRLVAENDEGKDEEEGEFSTYASPVAGPSCGNALLRTGFSAFLPDCRAYELVTPPDTNARAPLGIGHLGSTYFTTREASPDGNKVSFQIEGGTIPGLEGTGSIAGDPFLVTRTDSGWRTTAAGPTGVETSAVLPGSTSPDQGYSFWSTGSSEGTAVIGNYVRYPDGHSALVGRGSIAMDPHAAGLLISENGGHIVFGSGISVGQTAVQLEEDAPPDGTDAIYDRTSDEHTHTVSLLPGNVTPEEGEDAIYRGASLDGRGIAFGIGTTLYLRFGGETYEIGENVKFAGVAEGGGRIFYVEGGDLLAFDVATQTVLEFATGGDITPVNISADGSTAYFISPSALPVEPNPHGDFPQVGAENLYYSKEGAIGFVGTVTVRDVEGEAGEQPSDGLGLWLDVVEIGRIGAVPARTTPNGGVLLFESRANLTGYDPDGDAQIYRFDSSTQELKCLSCNPTGAAPSGSASLESVSQVQEAPEPFSSFVLVHNLRSDGRRAFFQSPDPLVLRDSDGLQDIYEWEEEGVGGCIRPGGCIYLISSGQSERPDYLYAVSDSGDDVFFRTSDLLLPSDSDETPSIYDARVGGGFPEGVEQQCEGEGCRPGLQGSPALGAPATPALGAQDNVQPSKKGCPKGKRKVKRHGKVRCVKKHRRHHGRSKHQGKRPISSTGKGDRA